MEATVSNHFVHVVSMYKRHMHHLPNCEYLTTGDDCEYLKVVLDGQTFESMAPGYYPLVGLDPDSYHPFLKWKRPDPYEWTVQDWVDSIEEWEWI